MNQLFIALSLISSFVAARQPFRVQFAQEIRGQVVKISIDGGRVHSGFAGKLGFRDQKSTWTSVCCAVRKPVSSGQYFTVRALNSSKVGGNIALAGNIVANCFKFAQTDDQCAGLQLAVWEAVEDGGARPNFLAGRFQAMGNQATMAYAEQYYAMIEEKKDAVVLEASRAGGQSQLAPTPDKSPLLPGARRDS